VTPAPTIRLRAYPAICAALLLAAVGLRRPELVAVAAPFGLVAAVGLARSAPPDVAAHITPGELRALEGDRVTAVVELTAARPAWQVDVALGVPVGLAPVDGPPRRAVRPGAGSTAVAFELDCERWGGYAVAARIRVHEPFGLLDCCPVSDGGAAYIVTTEARAKELQKTPVYVRGMTAAELRKALNLK